MTPSLRETADTALQERLDRRLNQNPRWRHLIAEDRLAVGLVDLRDEQARFAAVNGDEMMYAASLSKLALLSTACQAMEDGVLKEDTEVLTTLSNMIRYSSNPAATRVIDWLGYQRIERFLTDPEVRLYDPREGGGLWVGKRYGGEGERSPDPLEGLSHAATTTQVCRFYYLLYHGRLISPERSAQMLDFLSDPGIDHKFVRALRDRAPDAKLYRKSGTFRQWHSDSVLVLGPGDRQYILVGLVEDSDGERLLRELVAVAEDTLGLPGPEPREDNS